MLLLCLSVVANYSPPPRLLHTVFITEFDLINACIQMFSCVFLKPAIKNTPRKSKR